MITEFSSKPHIITGGGSDDYRPETGSRPATPGLSAVEPAGVVVEVDDIPKLEGKHKFLSMKVSKVHFKVFRNSFFRRPYRYISFALSYRYEVLNTDWLWIEVCRNVVLT